MLFYMVFFVLNDLRILYAYLRPFPIPFFFGWFILFKISAGLQFVRKNRVKVKVILFSYHTKAGSTTIKIVSNFSVAIKDVRFVLVSFDLGFSNTGNTVCPIFLTLFFNKFWMTCMDSPLAWVQFVEVKLNVYTMVRL